MAGAVLNSGQTACGAVGEECRVVWTILVVEDYGSDSDRVGFEVFPRGNPGAGVKDGARGSGLDRCGGHHMEVVGNLFSGLMMVPSLYIV